MRRAPSGTRYWHQRLGFWPVSRGGISDIHRKTNSSEAVQKNMKLCFYMKNVAPILQFCSNFWLASGMLFLSGFQGRKSSGLQFKDMSELKFQCHDDTWALIITLVSWLGYIGDYTTHLHRDANIWIAITLSSQYNGMAQGFWSLLTSILQSQPVHKRPLCWHQKLVFHQTCFSFFLWGVQMGFPVQEWNNSSNNNNTAEWLP